MGIGPLLVCGFGPFPAAPDNPAGLVVERLRAQGWAPPEYDLAYAVVPTEWAAAPDAALAAMEASGAAGLLLVGVSIKATGFQLELVARNHVDVTRADASGACRADPLVAADGPEARPVTGPAEAILEALRGHKLPAGVSTDAGAYLCNYTFYRLLGQVTQPIAFLHVPQARECAPGAGFGIDEIEYGVRVAAEAFARTLAPVAASR